MADKTLAFKIQIDGVSNEATELAKLEIQLKNIKKERAELMKQATSPGHIGSEEEKRKLAAYNKEVAIQEASLKTLKRVVDTASDSLARKKALLIELTAKSDRATQAIRDGMAPAILKLNNEIKAGENARGVFTRNVGNYPELANTAAGGINELAGSVGGLTSQVGNVATGFLTAAGPAGVFTAAISMLAAAWKRTQENIELYLKSADKVSSGFSGFQRDAEAARVDTRRRAEGQISVGVENLRLANYRLSKATTDEERQQLELMKQQAYEDIKSGNALKEQVTGQKDRITWTLKYNKLLQDQETIADEKLVKEVEWAKLEADLIKQRAIVSSQESTAAQMKQAAADADVIATKLAGDKTQFLNKEIDIVTAIAEMTATQEVVEDKINGMLVERNNILKEYYSDQIKINKLENKATKKEGAIEVKTPELVDKEKEYKLMVDENFKWELDAINEANDKQLAAVAAANEKEIEAEKKKNEALLDLEKAHQESKMNIAASVTNLISGIAGKNKALQKASLIADKALAIAEVIIQTRKANAATRAWGALAGPPGMVLAELAVAKNNIASVFNVGAIAAAAVTGLAGFKRGGKITSGVPVNTGTVDDTLIAVNKTETVLTAKHVQRLGGSGVMRRIGVPGYADGGYIGQQAPEMPIGGFDFERMASLMNSIEVTLNLNKVVSGLNELSVINETQKI